MPVATDNDSSAPSNPPHSTTNALTVQKSSGIAGIGAEESGEQGYGYYQDESNNIIEAQINGGVWQYPDGTTAQENVVTSNAEQGSPLAAISWSFQSVDYVSSKKWHPGMQR